METDIITEGFRKSEAMHRLQYLYLVGDSDSSLLYSVVTNVPYGRLVKKIVCCNHAVKCYRTHLEALVKDNPRLGGRGGLTKAMIVRIATIMYHSKTGDVAAQGMTCVMDHFTASVITPIVDLVFFTVVSHKIILHVIQA